MDFIRLNLFSIALVIRMISVLRIKFNESGC